MINMDKIEQGMKMFLEGIGEDPNRTGLIETPKRIARMWQEFKEFEEFKCVDFVEPDILCEGMVVVKNVPLYSICEHHLVPFFGKCSIGYIPDKVETDQHSVIGISKMARIVYKHAYRPQIQERLTKQIQQEVSEKAKSSNVIVVIDAQHLCMVMRGARAMGSSTVTIEGSGDFSIGKPMRKEFFSLIKM